jgi:hypothetical protein
MKQVKYKLYFKNTDCNASKFIFNTVHTNEINIVVINIHINPELEFFKSALLKDICVLIEYIINIKIQNLKFVKLYALKIILNNNLEFCSKSKYISCRLFVLIKSTYSEIFNFKNISGSNSLKLIVIATVPNIIGAIPMKKLPIL